MGFLFFKVRLKEITMPAIAPIEDLRNAQEELLSQSLVFTTDALPACSKPWRRQAPYDLR
jgi:hypothetical protein